MPSEEIVYTYPVLNHGRNRTTQVQVWGIPDPGGHNLTRITCQECNALGTPREGDNLQSFINRGREHADGCQNHYGPRSNECVKADRRGKPLCNICR